ncbi:MAG: hypothetical protein QM749_03395 [Aquabacterium sp.]
MLALIHAVQTWPSEQMDDGDGDTELAACLIQGIGGTAGKSP